MFLIPEQYHEDESLESYLLRVSQVNDFERYKLLSGAIKEHLRATDHEASGAFPLELNQINVFHAKQSSGFRIRAIHLMEQCLGLKPWQLYKLALKQTLNRISGSYSAVARQGVQIPRAFVRLGTVPVCPHCLHDAPYIRQVWHFISYSACTKHQCSLIDCCPACGRPLNYMRSESILHCQCGQDLSQISTVTASQEALTISRLLSGVNCDQDSPLAHLSASARLGALLFYWLRHRQSTDEVLSPESFEGVCDYYLVWPKSIYDELEVAADIAKKTQALDFNHVAFSNVFGPILQQAQICPSNEIGSNFVLKELANYLRNLVQSNPKPKVPNLGDVLLTVEEVSILLACSYEQVYRYYEEGYLKLSYRPRLHQKLTHYDPAFHLRQAIELQSAIAKCEPDKIAAW